MGWKNISHCVKKAVQKNCSADNFIFGRYHSTYEKALPIDSRTEYALPVDQGVQDSAGIRTQHCCSFSGRYRYSLAQKKHRA